MVVLDYRNDSGKNLVLHRWSDNGQELTPYVMMHPGQIVGIPEDVIRKTHNFEKFRALGWLSPIPVEPSESLVAKETNLGKFGGRKLDV